MIEREFRDAERAKTIEHSAGVNWSRRLIRGTGMIEGGIIQENDDLALVRRAGILNS